MASKKPKKTRAASKRAAQKKSPPRKTVAKSTARKKLASKGRAPTPVKRTRPKQHGPPNHQRGGGFKSHRPATLAKNRRLRIADSAHGLPPAPGISLVGPCNP